MKRMAEEGFLVASGGGPGAMEASSLGSMLKGKSAAEVQEALELIQTNNEQHEKEYLNVAAAELVTQRFGIPSPDTSPLNLGKYNEHHVYVNTNTQGVPTFEYGNEPWNRFSTWVCKFISKGVRQSSLTEIANAGAIFTAGMFTYVYIVSHQGHRQCWYQRGNLFICMQSG